MTDDDLADEAQNIDRDHPIDFKSLITQNYVTRHQEPTVPLPCIYHRTVLL